MSEIVVNSIVDPELAEVVISFRATEDAAVLDAALAAHPGYSVVSNCDLGQQMIEFAEGDEPRVGLVRRWTLRKA